MNYFVKKAKIIYLILILYYVNIYLILFKVYFHFLYHFIFWKKKLFIILYLIFEYFYLYKFLKTFCILKGYINILFMAKKNMNWIYINEFFCDYSNNFLVNLEFSRKWKIFIFQIIFSRERHRYFSFIIKIVNFE